MLVALLLCSPLILLALAFGVVLWIDERRETAAIWPLPLRDKSVVSVKFIYSSLLARITRHLFGVYALTIWRRVYVAKDYLVNTGMRHELEHVRQWHATGKFRFVWKYLRDRQSFEGRASRAAGQWRRRGSPFAVPPRRGLPVPRA